jgi:hypothetical protein
MQTFFALHLCLIFIAKPIHYAYIWKNLFPQMQIQFFYEIKLKFNKTNARGIDAFQITANSI